MQKFDDRKGKFHKSTSTYGHILISSSLDVAKPRSLLSVTTLRGSVHLDMAAGAQSFCAEIVGIWKFKPEKRKGKRGEKKN